MTTFIQARIDGLLESAWSGAGSWLLIPAGLVLLLSACDKDLQSRQEPFHSDSLWVAIVEKSSPSVIAGELVPIGRYFEGGWDLTWPGVFYRGSIASIDSIGDMTVDQAILPLIERIGPEHVYLKAPQQWHFYSDADQGDSLIVTHLALGRSHCGLRWVLSADISGQVLSEEFFGTASMAFSRPVEPISPGVEIPSLDTIEASLGLVRKDQDGDGYRNFVWLGFYRLEDGSKIGVLNDIGYEGESFQVISFRGNHGEVVVDVHGGGC